MLSKEEINALKEIKTKETITTRINKEKSELIVTYHSKDHSIPLLLDIDRAVEIENAKSSGDFSAMAKAVFSEEICTNFSQLAIEQLFLVYQEVLEIFNGATVGE